MKKLFLSLLIVPLLITSCASTSGDDAFNQSAYSRVQVIDVFDKSDIKSNSDNIPLSAIIQPSQLTTSPVIDISTLKVIETENGNVSSSTLLQGQQKKSIEDRLAAGEKDVDTTLVESYEGITTSGELATDATTKAFTFLSSPTDYIESIAEYDYIPGRIYEMITSPSGITDFRLQPGEQIAGTPITNQNSNWQFSMGTSIEDGESVQHLFVRPIKVGLDTSMIVLTNQRTYYFRLASFETQYMTAVRFRYPIQLDNGSFVAEDFDEYIQNASLDAAYNVDMTKADYEYRVKVTKGKPSWTPITVFSDETKTYFQMPVTIANNDDMPSIYLVKKGDENLVNYRIIGNLYQIDMVIDDPSQYFLMKSGQKEQVRIYRNI